METIENLNLMIEKINDDLLELKKDRDRRKSLAEDQLDKIIKLETKIKTLENRAENKTQNSFEEQIEHLKSELAEQIIKKNEFRKKNRRLTKRRRS